TGDDHAVLRREQRGAVERTLAADHDDALDAGIAEHRRGARAPGRLEELLAPRRAEDRPPVLDDVRDAGARHRTELASEQAGVAPADADHLETAGERVADDGADRGVHARRVAAAREDPDASHPGSIPQSATRRSRRAFAMTDTDERLIAALATIGLRRSPKAGYSTPAASGMPSVL